MGFVKSEFERLEELAIHAVRIVREVGAVTVYRGESTYQWDSDADRHAYARAMILTRAGKLNCTPKEAAAAIKRALQ